MPEQQIIPAPAAQPEKPVNKETEAKFLSKEEKPKPKDLVSLIITLLSAV
jgi:hypothetical protein